MSKVTEKVNKRKRQIVEQTYHLIKRTDFENLTVQRICTESNISIGTFYHYFARKDDLIVAMGGLLDDYICETAKKLLSSEGEAENVVRICRGYAEYMSAGGVCYGRILNSGSFGPNGVLRDRNRPLFLELQEAFARGMDKGQFCSQYRPEVLAEMTVDMLRGIYVNWSGQDGESDLVEKTVCFAKILVQILSTRTAQEESTEVAGREA